jgi:cytochrome o ubiquinol oxidase subunit 1
VRDREANRDLTGDAWGSGRTLEWPIPSPAPFYNFAVTPVVHDLDAFWDMKEKNQMNPNTQLQPHYDDIHMPRNTATGFIIVILSGVFGFGIVWDIYWMVGLGLIGIFATVMNRTFNSNVDYYLKSDEIIAHERARSQDTRETDSDSQDGSVVVV